MRGEGFSGPAMGGFSNLPIADMVPVTVGQREHNSGCLSACIFSDNLPAQLTNDRSTKKGSRDSCPPPL